MNLFSKILLIIFLSFIIFYIELQSNFNIKESFNINNFNIKYHNPADVVEKDYGYGPDIQERTIFDPELNAEIKTKIPNNQTLPIYYEPGKYKYGSKVFVPDYADSIYLSK